MKKNLKVVLFMLALVFIILLMYFIFSFAKNKSLQEHNNPSETTISTSEKEEAEQFENTDTSEENAENLKEDVDNTEASEESASGSEDEEKLQANRTPSKTEVVRMREMVLEGMTEEEIKRLKTNIKDFNAIWESRYFYSDIFEELEDPESLSWNYIDARGDIAIGVAENSDGTTQEVIAYNRFDAESLVEIIADMQKSVENEALYHQLQTLIDEINLASQTHDVEHVKNMFYMLHDLDYFLLRYGIEDVGKYTDDATFVATYYGTLDDMYEELWQ